MLSENEKLMLQTSEKNCADMLIREVKLLGLEENAERKICDLCEKAKADAQSQIADNHLLTIASLFELKNVVKSACPFADGAETVLGLWIKRRAENREMQVGKDA